MEGLVMPLRQRRDDSGTGRAPDLNEVIDRILNGGGDPSPTPGP
ncbi:hypothetical protein ACTG0T_02435 [Halococcus morrhuae DSM 1307]|nr:MULTISPECIES: hypothetical protein [Halococcus]